MVELLLAKGVSVDPVSFEGTPLYAAALEGHDEIMQILLENNADVGLTTYYFLLIVPSGIVSCFIGLAVVLSPLYCFSSTVVKSERNYLNYTFL